MMTIRPISPDEWNARFAPPDPRSPAERVRAAAPHGLTVTFEVHGGRIYDAAVKDAWTDETGIAWPEVTPGAITALVKILTDITSGATDTGAH
jgi:hypothetical protein